MRLFKNEYSGIILSLLLVIAAGCKKDTTQPTVSPPSWSVNTSGKYPLTMTAVLEPPPNLELYVASSDKLGAFVGNECRGIGEVVIANNKKVFFVMIRGTASEQSMISFKYYQSLNSHLFKTNAVLNFTVDSNYGTVDDPVELNLVPAN